MTSFERARRNEKMVDARLRGFGERRVAEMYGVSERHVRRVFREYRDSRPALHERDPADALADTLDAYQALIDEAIELADNARHEGVRLGALRLRVAVLDARLGLTPGLGLVPAEVERARMVDEVRQLVRQIMEVFELRGVPEHVQREVLDVVEGRQLAELPAGANGAAVAA